MGEDAGEGRGGGTGSAAGADARRRRRRIGDLEIAALLFVLAAAYFSLTLGRTFDLRDEGYIYYNVKRVAEGALPHRDFVCLYGPGVYLLSALAYRASGEEIMGVRVLIAALRAGAVVLVFLIARHLVPRSFALIGAALATAWWGKVIWNLNTPYAALYTIPLGLGALLLLLRGVERDARRLYALAGLTAGLGVLFKQSLGLVVGYGLMLAIAAGSMLRATQAGPARPRERDPLRCALLVLWALAGAALVAPFTRQMSAFDYALHFLPLHALMALLAYPFARRGEGRAALAHAWPRLLAFAGGFSTPPLLLVLLYASWGAADELLYEMFVFPSHLQHYYLSVVPPPPTSWAVLLCVVTGVSGALLSLRRHWIAAVPLLALAGGLAAVVASQVPNSLELGVHVTLLSGVLPACVAYTGLALLSPNFLRRSASPATEQLLIGAVPCLFFQLMMNFQIFPRATYNVTLMLGALAPLLALALQRWTHLAGASLSPTRARIATALVALLPLALAFHTVADNLDKRTIDEAAHTDLAFAGTAGIRVAEKLYEIEEIAAFEWAIDYIDRTSSPDTPIALLTNEFMLHVVSRRPDLFPEFTYYLFLFGWDLLPDAYTERMPEEVLIERLARSPDPIVLDKDDDASLSLRHHYPGLFRYIEGHFRVEYRVGSYSVLRKNPS